MREEETFSSFHLSSYLPTYSPIYLLLGSDEFWDICIGNWACNKTITGPQVPIRSENSTKPAGVLWFSHRSEDHQPPGAGVHSLLFRGKHISLCIFNTLLQVLQKKPQAYLLHRISHLQKFLSWVNLSVVNDKGHFIIILMAHNTMCKT